MIHSESDNVVPLRPSNTSVNTRINLIRPEIPHDLISLNQWFISRGWSLHLSNCSHTHAKADRWKVEAHRHHWLGLSVYHYEWLYYSQDMSESQAIFTTRKLAELCERLAECFTDSYPQPFVEQDGHIYADPALAAMVPSGQLAVLNYISQQLTRKQSLDSNTILHQSDFINVCWGSPAVLMNIEHLIRMRDALNATNS